MVRISAKFQLAASVEAILEPFIRQGEFQRQVPDGALVPPSSHPKPGCKLDLISLASRATDVLVAAFSISRRIFSAGLSRTIVTTDNKGISGANEAASASGLRDAWTKDGSHRRRTAVWLRTHLH